MRKLQYITISLLLIFLVGCKEDFSHRSFYLMGTIVELTLPLKGETLVKEINVTMRAEEINIISLTEQINGLDINQKLPLDKDSLRVLDKATYFWKLSKGHFDITTAGISNAHGFPEGPYKIPNSAILEPLLKNSGFEHLTLNNGILSKSTPLMIHTGAYTKGYIVDRAIQHLKNKNIENGLINAGGDLYALGTKNGKKWRIAIKNPNGSKEYLSVVNLSNMALATSGNYERFFEENGQRITHIFDGLSGQSANTYQSISVISDSTETSDGLATVFYLQDIDTIKTLCNQLKTPVLIYTLDNQIHKLCDWETYETAH